MDQLKLKYVIDLVSNISAKSRSDAQTLVESQKKIEEALGKTKREAGLLERTLLNVGRVGSASAARQADYLARLAMSYNKVRTMAEGATKAMQLAAGVGASATAGAFAANAMLKKPVDYDTRLRGVAATAFAGQNVAGLRAGLADVNGLVVNTVQRTPGASRDRALEAFEKLVGSGSFTYDESKALLPSIMKTSVAGRADAADLVAAAEKMKVNFKLTPAQIEVALAKIMRGGQEGGFEIKDAAKWIGPLAPFMKGYKGMAAVEQMVTMMQQVRATAGTNDEAANNLRNFIQKLGADSTRKDFKKQGFNLDAEMAAGVLRNETPVATYMALLDKVMAKNDPAGKARAAMEKADKSTSPEERAAKYEDIKKIYEDAAVSAIINDLQEFGGYEGLRRTGEYGKKVLAAVQGETGGAVETGFQFMGEGSGAKMTAAENARDIAATDAFNKLAPALNSMLDGAVGLSKEYPEMSANVALATGALGVFSAALMGSGLVSLLAGGAGSGLLRRVGGIAGLAGLAGVGGTAVAAGATATVGTGAAATLAAAGGAARKALGLPALLFSELFLTSDSDMAVLNNADRMRQGYRGKGFVDERLKLTAPGMNSQGVEPGRPTEIKVGEGKIDVLVRLQDDRTTVSPTVTQQLPLARLDAGATNPGGYGR